MRLTCAGNRLFVGILLAASFSGCRHWGGTRTRVRIGDARRSLAPVRSFSGDAVFVQQVEGTMQGRTFRYNLQGEIIAGEWTLVGLTPGGFRLFVLNMREREIDYDARWGFHLELPPNLLLTAWQLAYWPEPDGAPPPGAWEVDIRGTSLWNGPVRVRIPGRDLSLTFRTLAYERL